MVGLSDKRAQYSWALQGGGIGVLYLTIFAAMKLYQLIPAGPAFALLAAVAFLSAFIAVKQLAMPLTILGLLMWLFTKAGARLTSWAEALLLLLAHYLVAMGRVRARRAAVGRHGIFIT